MKPELEDQLIRKYPSIFRDIYKSPQETCMCWGIECGDGWYDLIDTFLGIATYILGEHSYFLALDQIKEKYGTLRIYYRLECYDRETLEDIPNNLIDVQYTLIDKLSDLILHMSAFTCEYCGKPGKTRGRNWYITLCNKCFTTLKKERNV